MLWKLCGQNDVQAEFYSLLLLVLLQCHSQEVVLKIELLCIQNKAHHPLGFGQIMSWSSYRISTYYYYYYIEVDSSTQKSYLHDHAILHHHHQYCSLFTYGPMTPFKFYLLHGPFLSAPLFLGGPLKVWTIFQDQEWNLEPVLNLHVWIPTLAFWTICFFIHSETTSKQHLQKGIDCSQQQQHINFSLSQPPLTSKNFQWYLQNNATNTSKSKAQDV